MEPKQSLVRHHATVDEKRRSSSTLYIRLVLKRIIIGKCRFKKVKLVEFGAYRLKTGLNSGD